MPAVRDRPHLMLGTPLRCCLKCQGQTWAPCPAQMIHESTCRLFDRRRPPVFDPPADWRDRIGVA